MQDAPSLVPPSLPSTSYPTAGVDWSRDDHAVAIVQPDGQVSSRFSVRHTAAGLRELVARLENAGVQGVAIERPDGPVVNALLGAALTVFFISPNRVKNLRSRFGSAGNKDDRFDAFVLADTVRTDRHRLRPLIPDCPATLALRSACRARKDLVGHRVALANQLRDHLKHVFPGAVGLFAEIDSPISLRFLSRFGSQERADRLSAKRFEAWLNSVGYSGRTSPQELYRRLMSAPRGATGLAARALAQITAALVAVLDSLLVQIRALEAQIAKQLAAHVDAPIFTSLPRSGTVRAARLLGEIGDCRARFPTPASMACLAGVAPSTKQSGKLRVVTFRWAADNQLRDAVCDFAADSRHANPWAAHLYRQARDNGHDHPHAVRILARAWLYVIWHCWQQYTPYDPARHRALQAIEDAA